MRHYKAGDRAVAIFPAGRRPGLVISDRDGLGFNSDRDNEQATWTMPIDEHGRCTYSTHKHVYLVPEEK